MVTAARRNFMETEASMRARQLALIQEATRHPSSCISCKLILMDVLGCNMVRMAAVQVD